MKKKNHEDKTHQTVHENEEMEKRQEIYESEIEEEKMVYRCTKQDCISAFLQ